MGITEVGNGTEYDLIVIGSGIGGLTVASLVAQLDHKRVLVLDRHFKLGGFTHTFKRHGYEWETGIHYVGGMKEGKANRRFMDLVTGGQVQWRRITDPYDTFIYPEFEFGVSAGVKDYQRDLIRLYPESRSEIRRYFRALKMAANWGERTFAVKTMPRQLAPLVLAVWRSLGTATTAEVLNRYISDPELRALLASQWGDYGLPPGQSAFAQHAIVARDYFDGGYYPEGGGADLAAAVTAIVEAEGGRCLTKHTVTGLDIEHDRVTRVWAEHRGEPVSFTAPVVVSAIGAGATYNGLIPSDFPLPERSLLDDPVEPPTMVILNVGLTDDPRRHGFGETNYWMFDDLDHDSGFADRHRLVDGVVNGCFLSFPSLRLTSPGLHTAQIITSSDYDSWRAWEDQPWLRRDDSYTEVKTRVSEALVDFVEKYRPGFKSIVGYTELATPLTVRSMTGHAGGGVYGRPATPRRFAAGGFPVTTAVKNLYLSGCDVGCLGVNGSLMGGVMTASVLLGSAGYPRLLAASYRRRPLLSDEPMPVGAGTGPGRSGH